MVVFQIKIFSEVQWFDFKRDNSFFQIDLFNMMRL